MSCIGDPLRTPAEARRSLGRKHACTAYCRGHNGTQALQEEDGNVFCQRLSWIGEMSDFDQGEDSFVVDLLNQNARRLDAEDTIR